VLAVNFFQVLLLLDFDQQNVILEKGYAAGKRLNNQRAGNGKVTITEAEVLRIIGDSLDCPIPPLMPGQDMQDSKEAG